MRGIMTEKYTFLNSGACLKRFYETPFELRVICEKSEGRYKKAYSMLPTQWGGLSQEIQHFNNQDNVYIVLNPLKNLCAEKPISSTKFTRLSVKKGINGTQDHEVAKYRWLLVDLDPKRPSGIASTEEEKDKAYAKIQEVKDFMLEKGFNHPVVSDSGNGFHLYFRIDLENTLENTDLVKRVLIFLSDKFSNSEVGVDKTVFNPARLTKLQGTWSRKGENDISSGRIHRKSGFIEFPEDVENKINSIELLESVASPKTELAKHEVKSDEECREAIEKSLEFLRGFLERHEILYDESFDSTGFKFHFQDGCPFDSSHRRKDAYLHINKVGARIFKCSHDSCSDYKWLDFVRLYEPNYMNASERQERDDKFLEELLAEYGEVKEEFEGLAEEPLIFRRDKKGKILSDQVDNYTEVFEKDKKFRGKMGYNEMQQAFYDRENNEPWTEGKDVKALAYIQRTYGFGTYGNLVIAMRQQVEDHKYNPLLEILESLEWDGVPRVRRALIKFLGCEDSKFSEDASHCMFLGAVKRAYEPGCQFDIMYILIGAQGKGKSLFCKKMALRKEFFTDTLQSFDNQESSETLSGVWIAEWSELDVMKRAKDASSLKKFITQTDMKCRPAYGRNTKSVPRRCIFIGTTNEDEFLSDPTGNRRFIPLKIGVKEPEEILEENSHEEEFKQMMAEAVYLYKQGQRPKITNTLKNYAQEARETHAIQNPMIGLIRNWIEKHPQHERICTKMVHEALYPENRVLDRRLSMELTAILSHSCNLIKATKQAKLPIYGTQTYWTRDETWKGIPAPTHEDELAEGQYELDKLNYTEFEEI